MEFCKTTFGMMMPGRTYTADNSYRYGFNDKEMDNEVKGTGAQYDYGFRIYDSRIGKFLSVDPLSKKYPWNSSYAYAENDVIRNVDLDGAERMPYYNLPKHGSKTTLENIDGINVYTFNEQGTEFRVAEYGTRLMDDGPFNTQYPRTVYLVNDVNVINNSDYVVGDGSIIRTKGTNWHFWKTSNEQSNASKVVNEAADRIATTTFKSAYFGASLFTGGTSNLLTTAASRLFTEAGGEFMSTGGDVSKINVTAVALSPVFGNSWKNLAVKNIVNSFAEVNATQGYNGVQLTTESIRSKSIQAGVGFTLDKLLANYQTAPDFNPSLYSRLRNLSYKPKYATQYSNFLMNYSMKLNASTITNSGAVGVISTAGGNVASDAAAGNNE